MKMKWIVLILLLLVTVGCSKKDATKPEAASVEDLLTKDNEISGWRFTGTPWIARSSDELYTHIDGIADIYSQRGFVEAAMQQYNGTIDHESITIELRIFDQGDSINAKAVYNDPYYQSGPWTDWVEGVGENAKYERSVSSLTIIFWHSKYFVYITAVINTNQDLALEVLKTFAINVDSKIE